MILPLRALLAVMLLAPLCAQADQFYITVGFDCATQANELRIAFRGDWGEAGERLIAKKKNTWNTLDLADIIDIDGPNFTMKNRPRIAYCVLRKARYKIMVSPAYPFRYHPEGNCATRMGARVRVLSGKTVIADGQLDGCTETHMVPTDILIKPGKPVTYAEVDGFTFYSGMEKE